MQYRNSHQVVRRKGEIPLSVALRQPAFDCTANAFSSKEEAFFFGQGIPRKEQPYSRFWGILAAELGMGQVGSGRAQPITIWRRCKAVRGWHFRIGI